MVARYHLAVAVNFHRPCAFVIIPEAIEGIFHHFIHVFTVESCNRIVACTYNGTWDLFAMIPALSGKMSGLMVQDQSLRSKLSPNRQCSLTDLLLGGQSICVVDPCKLLQETGVRVGDQGFGRRYCNVIHNHRCCCG